MFCFSQSLYTARSKNRLRSLLLNFAAFFRSDLLTLAVCMESRRGRTGHVRLPHIKIMAMLVENLEDCNRLGPSQTGLVVDIQLNAQFQAVDD